MEEKEEKKNLRYLIGGVVIYYLIYYIPYFMNGMVLRGDDYRWEDSKNSFGMDMFFGAWNSKSGLLGGGHWGYVPQPTGIWVRLFPAVFATNTMYMYMFALMIWATYLFFRAWRVSSIPAILAAVLTAFSPGFHTFIRTGHIDKIMLNPFMMFAFAFITMFFRRNRFKFCYAFLTAFSLAMGFIDGDPQLFLFFGPFFTLYALMLFGASHQDGLDPVARAKSDDGNEKSGIKEVLLKNFIENRKLIPFFLLIPLMAGAMSFNTIAHNFERLTTSGSLQEENQQSETTPSETQENLDLVNWYWATQWSFPKLETLDLFVPGFMGFLSRSPSEPYWGRVGQTEGWDEKREGYQNYSLMANYLGVFFIIFMIYGLVYAHPAVRIGGSVLLILFMFLSYGKFFFLYRWVYELPYMDNLRNPNRFLQLFHFTAAIVFGFGLSHYYLRMKARLSNRNQGRPFNFFLIFFVVVVVLGLLVLIGLFSEESRILAYFSDRFPYQTANLIVSNMFFYWIKAMIVFSIACLLLHFATQKISFQNAKVWVGVMFLFGLADVYVVNNKFYLFENPQDRFNTTRFHQLFRGEVPGYTQYKLGDPMDTERMYFLKRNRKLEGQYIEFLYYNGNLPLKLFEFPIVRKLSDFPKDYLTYFQTVNNPDLRMLQVPGIGYVFSEFPVSHPVLELIYTDEIKNLNEKVFLYRVKNTFPLFYLRGEVEFSDNYHALFKRLNENTFNIYNTTIIYNNTNNDKRRGDELTQEQIQSLENHPENRVRIKEKISDGEYILQVDLKTPVILVMNNDYHDSWDAFGEDKVLPHFPVNYFFNGFYLIPEVKEVKVRFRSPFTLSSMIKYTLLLDYIFLAVVIVFMIKNKEQSGSKSNRKHRK